MLNEANKTSSTYKVYKRGTLVKTDFKVGIGSEMSQVHFTLILSKYDNPKNNVITVLPLTSKSGKNNLYLGSLIIDSLMNKIKTKTEKLDNLKSNESTKEIDDYYLVQIKKIEFILNYYQKT